MSDGSRFQKTVLPSFAEPTKLQEEPQDAIEDFDAMHYKINKLTFNF